MMETPFNFPIKLAEMPNQTGPARMQVLESRPSASRRGGHKVTIGFAQADKPQLIPVIQFRLEMN